MLAVKFELKPLFMLKLGLTKDFGQTLCKYDTYKKNVLKSHTPWVTLCYQMLRV